MSFASTSMSLRYIRKVTQQKRRPHNFLLPKTWPGPGDGISSSRKVLVATDAHDQVPSEVDGQWFTCVKLFPCVLHAVCGHFSRDA